MGKILLIILAIFLLLAGFSDPILDGIHGWRVSDTTESHSVTTGAGATTANVTLTKDLFQDEVSEVVSITSNISGESPIATSYVAATNYLLISALNPSATHTLTVNYSADPESSVMLAIGPFLGIFIIGGLLLGIIVQNMKKH